MRIRWGLILGGCALLLGALVVPSCSLDLRGQETEARVLLVWDVLEVGMPVGGVAVLVGTGVLIALGFLALFVALRRDAIAWVVPLGVAAGVSWLIGVPKHIVHHVRLPDGQLLREGHPFTLIPRRAFGHVDGSDVVIALAFALCAVVLARLRDRSAHGVRSLGAIVGGALVLCLALGDYLTGPLHASSELPRRLSTHLVNGRLLSAEAWALHPASHALAVLLVLWGVIGVAISLRARPSRGLLRGVGLLGIGLLVALPWLQYERMQEIAGVLSTKSYGAIDPLRAVMQNATMGGAVSNVLPTLRSHVVLYGLFLLIGSAIVCALTRRPRMDRAPSGETSASKPLIASSQTRGGAAPPSDAHEDRRR